MGLILRDDQLDRYARHIVLREVGGAGQARLLTARVVVVGAGGIGSPVVQYCAAAGIGRIVLIDDDRVERSNLQRQTLFGESDIGRPKVDAARDAAHRLNPDCVVESVQRRIDAVSADALIAGADVVVDGTDNFATRFAVADAGLRARVPLISAAVGQFDGQLGVFRGWEAGKPCYRCWVGSAPDRADASCADQGVVGALTGIVGSMAALEVLRAILSFGEDPAGSILLMDLLGGRFRRIQLPADPACPACSSLS